MARGRASLPPAKKLCGVPRNDCTMAALVLVFGPFVALLVAMVVVGDLIKPLWLRRYQTWFQSQSVLQRKHFQAGVYLFVGLLGAVLALLAIRLHLSGGPTLLAIWLLVCASLVASVYIRPMLFKASSEPEDL